MDILDAWRTGGPQLVAIVIAVAAVVRLSKDKEEAITRMSKDKDQLYERIIDQQREQLEQTQSGTRRHRRERP